MGIEYYKTYNDFHKIHLYWYHEEELKDWVAVPFYDNWDDIMEVIEKIEEMSYIDVYINGNNCRWDIDRFQGKTKMEAVLKFIDWWLDNEYETYIDW
jgi:hypothetical protein